MPTSAPPARSRTESVHATLRADVLACRLRPGERLRINDLASRLDVSPGAVREALSRLTAEGLVVAEAQRGFAVAPVSAEDLRDLTAVRIEIERHCLERALAVGGVDWEADLVAAFHRLSRTPERAQGDEARVSDDWAAAHGAFHLALVSACDSPWLLRLRALLYAQSERYRRLSVPAAPHARNLDAEHRGLMDAALARDRVAVLRLMAEHLSTTATLVLGLTEPLAQAAASGAT